MPKRTRPKLSKPPTSYFVGDKPSLRFLTSGCTLLDCALGGGYAIGRIANIVGDKSTAKTALATEAMINFIHQYPKSRVAYRETEAAFDKAYAEAMGLKLARVDFGNEDKPLLTVEDFGRDLDQFLDEQISADLPGIYVLDSLDALSDEAEMAMDFGKGTFGTGKAKFLSSMLRQTARKVEQSQVLLLIVSQVRENIGVTFGEKYRRAGGKALDFYASQIMWLAQIKQLRRTINKVERPFGVEIKAKVKKNKVGIAFREAEFDFIFGFGVDDVGASVKWLAQVGRLKEAESKAYMKEVDLMNDRDYQDERMTLGKMVKEAWAEIETTFLPARKKYT